MKTVTNSYHVSVEVTKEDLINDKWLNFFLLSKKLEQIEDKNKEAYKALRSKFYNSWNCGKYNTCEIAGIKCINVEKPMEAKASLDLEFIVR